MSHFAWYPGAHAALESAFGNALNKTAEDIVLDVERRGVVPYAESAQKRGHEAGKLARSVAVQPVKASAKGARIVWNAPYATRAYFHPDWQFSTVVHGNARGRWMDDYMDGERTAYVRDRYRHHLGIMGVLL